jgi:hypothetical protein
MRTIKSVRYLSDLPAQAGNLLLQGLRRRLAPRYGGPDVQHNGREDTAPERLFHRRAIDA